MTMKHVKIGFSLLGDEVVEALAMIMTINNDNYDHNNDNDNEDNDDTDCADGKEP